MAKSDCTYTVNVHKRTGYWIFGVHSLLLLFYCALLFNISTGLTKYDYHEQQTGDSYSQANTKNERKGEGGRKGGREKGSVKDGESPLGLGWGKRDRVGEREREREREKEELNVEWDSGTSGLSVTHPSS